MVKDFHVGVGTNAERGGRRLESNGFVKPGPKVSDGLVHDDNCRAFVDADDAAKPVVAPNNIPGAQAEGVSQRPPNQADKLGLAWVVGRAYDGFRSHKLGVEVAKASEAGMAGIAQDHMVKDFDFQKLPGADEVAGYLDIRFAWARVA